MAFLMEFTVLSILTTTPLRSPCDGCDPMPIISTPRSVISPTTAQTFDVPISKPTTMLCFLAIALERAPGVAPCLPNYPNPCVTPLGKRSYREPPDPQPQNGSPK